MRLVIVLYMLSSALMAHSQEVKNLILNDMLVEGEKVFYKELGMKIRYPKEAMSNYKMGLSVFSFTVNCKNRIDGLEFETKLGYGIEAEIKRLLKTFSLDWKDCSQRDKDQRVKMKLAFSLNKKFKSEEAEFTINAMGIR